MHQETEQHENNLCLRRNSNCSYRDSLFNCKERRRREACSQCVSISPWILNSGAPCSATGQTRCTSLASSWHGVYN
jgi:hypothetical protein